MTRVLTEKPLKPEWPIASSSLVKTYALPE
jgi:hypothetical protein